MWHRSPWHRGPVSQLTIYSERSWSSLIPFTKNNIHALGQWVKGSEILSGRLIRKVAQQNLFSFTQITLSNNQILPRLASEPSNGEISLLHCWTIYKVWVKTGEIPPIFEGVTKKGLSTAECHGHCRLVDIASHVYTYHDFPLSLRAMTGAFPEVSNRNYQVAGMQTVPWHKHTIR